MQEIKKENILTMWVKWHFYEAPKFLFSVWNNYIFFVSNYFSVFLLISTFFSPWRRYKWSYPRGFDISGYYQVFISNFFSRIVGAMLRLVLIIFGVVSQVLVVIAGIIVILIWVLMPFVAIALIILMLYV
ncbi:MAG: hypothetical protein A3F47_01755 [Candidatus Staskawiczbacteria bacterium RIFCSPHIGHO2_12_FULL_38_11]|uniref:Uncharacterized protein n=1 Tax=Candidatus Staskawiczbacteria bacterium RIFCSPHIGHO2_12_FULL_38_11 TaxID=1802209 RepID=A0A1G2I5W3_9BACT|nr:MAG: hypothetical protein A3F47_01755 [Candidatus Staskawiczbacteria bacterium RIFCSPHIGHO2_12_FULL_38_11]